MGQQSSMTRNVHLYGKYGAEVGVLGWILERSDTYLSSNFIYDTAQLDPWDNHSDLDTHWTHTWIEIQESGRQLDRLNQIMDTGPTPGVWGISYGAWKAPRWHTDAFKVGILQTEQACDYYWKNYALRTIHDVKEAFDLHIHDHYQNDSDRKKYMYNTYADYLERDSIAFWKLQAIFHWGFDRTVTDADYEAAKQEVRRGTSRYPADITLDIFSLDIENLCSILECKYNENMTHQYNLFLEYAKQQ